jgi:hypothetical protein
MIQTDAEFSSAIFASDGATIHCLVLHSLADGSPVLIDNAGARIAPWEVELLRWPPSDEAALRLGGYLPVCRPEPEIWCNCAD